MLPALAPASLEEIPVYREGSTDAECAALATQDPAAFHCRAYRALGPVYRTMLGDQNALFFAGLESNEFVWKNTQLWTYHNLLAAFREELGNDHVTAIDGPHHRQKRNILKPAFDQAPAMRYLPQYNSIFHERLKETPAQDKIGSVHWWAKTILVAQSKTVARTEIPDPLLDQFVAWEKALLSGIRLGDDRIAYYSDPDYVRMKANVLGHMGKMVDERLAEPDKYDDNFAPVMKARMEAEGAALSRENLIDDLYLVLLAGVENTAKLISSALLAILRDPAWLAELRAEVDAWDGQNVMALSGMTRLKATIMETQRVYPTVLINSRQAAQDFEYGGYTIPAGTVIFHMHTLCHYLEEFYPDPFQFKPERFVEQGRFVTKSIGFFGGGTHVCLGRNHTLLQTPIALAHTLKYYDVSLIDEESTTDDGPLIPGQLIKELWVHLSPRKS